MDDLAHDKARLASGLLTAGRQWRRLTELMLVPEDVSEACAAPLIWLARLGGGVNQVTLAAHIGIEGTSLVRLLDQLSAAGLVERREDPEDRRAKTIWLTAAGAARAERIESLLIALRDRVFGAIGGAEIRAALRVFRAIGDADTGAAA